MMPVGPATRIYLAAGATDLRKSFEGLSDQVRQRFKEDPLSGHLFVFANRKRHQTKFSIPIRHRSHRVPVASTARAAVASSPAKGTKRDRGH